MIPAFCLAYLMHYAFKGERMSAAKAKTAEVG